MRCDTRPRSPFALAGLLAAAFLVGCTPLNLRDNLSLWRSDPQPQTPTRVVAFWTDEVLSQPGKTPVRGFAGRVMFYNDKDKGKDKGKDMQSVVVEGTFTVFAFEDTDGDGGYSAPEKRFVYLPEQLKKYYSPSELGPSYSLWLPWDEVGGPERKLCLIARFEPRKDPPVVSGPAHKVLPGTPPQPGEPGSKVMRMTKSESPRPVRPVAFDAAIPPQSPPAPAAAAFTIDVPREFAERSQHPAGQATDPQAGPGAGSARPAESVTSQPLNRSAVHAPAVGSGEPRSGEAVPDSAGAATPADRYARPRFPAQREPAARPRYDPVRRQPLPATWQPRLPPTPRSDWPGAAQESPSTDGSAPR